MPGTRFDSNYDRAFDLPAVLEHPGPPDGSDVELNPQPIPPGLDADVGEPLTSAAPEAPRISNSSIIIVGGPRDRSGFKRRRTPSTADRRRRRRPAR